MNTVDAIIDITGIATILALIGTIVVGLIVGGALYWLIERIITRRNGHQDIDL